MIHYYINIIYFIFLFFFFFTSRDGFTMTDY